MKKILINYSNAHFRKSQIKNSQSGKKRGFDDIIQYTEKDIDKYFYKKNVNILKKKRGGGYWLWKPYVILQTLKNDQIKNGDLIFYCDSGSKFINDIAPIQEYLYSLQQDILAFQIPQLQKDYTKRDVFLTMDLDQKQYSHTPMIQGGNIILIKSDFSIKFFSEFLHIAQSKGMIDDSPSKEKNYEGFIEHRHDQSIFSLLYKKYNLKTTKVEKYENIIFVNNRIASRNFLQKITYYISFNVLKNAYNYINILYNRIMSE